MQHFRYCDGALHCEGVGLREIAEAVGTPCYVYSTATLERHWEAFARRLTGPRRHAYYAMKANSNLGVLQTLARLGAGADTVSEGEIRKALAAGVPPERIVFSGVGKAERELAFAVREGIYQVNIETEGELDLLDSVARAQGRRQDAVFRVNPDVGAGGHAKITTGGAADKFGVAFDQAPRLYARASALQGVRILGLALHIGSQIRELGALEAAFRKMRGLVTGLRAEGRLVERLDLGGGLGIPYRLDASPEEGPELIASYAAMIERVLGGLDVELGFEPGRLIVGNAGVLLARVLTLNPRPGRAIVVLDAAMNDLVRPAMYDAWHDIWPVTQPAPGAALAETDVVGPVCESGDTFAKARALPPLAPGDLVAFMTAGAYGATMSSTYNQRLLAPEVLVRGDEWAVTRPRQTYEALLGQDVAPPWLAGGRSQP